MAFVGLRANDGNLFLGDTLAGMNDAGHPFPKIADIIESNPPGLFLTDEELADRMARARQEEV